MGRKGARPKIKVKFKMDSEMSGYKENVLESN